ncbi:MAG TPA: alpha/beta fold hydrolase [Ideonella sp.]|nr:alpha/beta fold hydrolase [Ideonella sp.]
MLARLQQVFTLAWLAAIVGWGWVHWAQREPVRAVLGSLAIACAHAAWLGFGFCVMRWQNRRDPAPPASWRQWRGAWWAEVRTAPLVFCWRQPFRSRAEPDHLPAPHARGRVGVLLVHGFVCNRGVWNPWMRRFRAEGIPFVAVNLEPVFGSIDHYGPLIEAAVRKLEIATGKRPLLVGHSMGGLAIRAWLRDYQGDARIRGVVTLGTPHRGTWFSRLALHGNGREMRIGGDWLKRLAASENASRRRLFLCCFSHCDNIVFPASCAVLPDAEALHVPGAAHVDLIYQPDVIAEVLRRIGPGFRRSEFNGGPI